MALTSSIRDGLEREYGCSLRTLNDSPQSIRHVATGEKRVSGLEIVGRGYVYFGKSIDPGERDRENRSILKHW
jgi:hypothetical protein